MSHRWHAPCRQLTRKGSGRTQDAVRRCSARPGIRTEARSLVKKTAIVAATAVRIASRAQSRPLPAEFAIAEHFDDEPALPESAREHEVLAVRVREARRPLFSATSVARMPAVSAPSGGAAVRVFNQRRRSRPRIWRVFQCCSSSFV